MKSKNSEFISSTIVTKIFNDSLDIVDMQVRNQKEGLFLLNEIFDHYSKFNIDDVSVTRTISADSTKRDKIKEIIIFNYD